MIQLPAFNVALPPPPSVLATLGQIFWLVQIRIVMFNLHQTPQRKKVLLKNFHLFYVYS
jgi:hypothetical protein